MDALIEAIYQDVYNGLEDEYYKSLRIRDIKTMLESTDPNTIGLIDDWKRAHAWH